MGRASNYKSPSTIRRNTRRLLAHLHKIIVQTRKPKKSNLSITYIPSTSYIPKLPENPQPTQNPKEKPFTLLDFAACAEEENNKQEENKNVNVLKSSKTLEECLAYLSLSSPCFMSF